MTNHSVVSPGTKIEKRLARLAGGLVLVAALTPIVAPAVLAQSVEVRVYDGHHRDYHNWNDREDRAYRRWVAERHYEYREYNRQSARRQRAYWNWRHSHPD
jgi:hypothetical protein